MTLVEARRGILGGERCCVESSSETADGFTWLADKLGIASMPTGMNNKHLGVVGMLGGIGFTMCLLLTEVALPSAMQTIPKLAVLMASAVAALVSAGAMSMLPKVDDGELKELADGVVDKLE